MAVAEGVPAQVVVDALGAAGATHAVVVPDTNQRTVLDLIAARGAPPVVRCATEDDVFGCCAGLWLAGRRPVAVIQQLGLFAGANALRGMVHDQGVPLAIVAGLYGRDVDVAPEDDPGSAVRLCRPLLDALEVPWALVEGPGDAGLIAAGLHAAFAEDRANVTLLGAATT